jgi:ice-binding like protein
MENQSMETSKPSIAKKLRRSLLALLLISAIVGGAAGVTLFVTQNFTYKAPTTATVQTAAALDFGLLSSIASSSKTFTNGLIVGSGTTINITFAFVSPTLTWNTVFSGIAIVVQTKDAVGKVCISLGTATCPAGLTTKFIPTSSTSYDYVATYTTALVIPTGVSLQVIWAVTPVSIAQTTIPLGTAANFAVLAGATVTSTGLTVITGDLGLSPGTAVTGIPPGIVNGALHTGDATAAIAKTDLLTAINTANALTLPILLAGDLGGRTLVPGLYKSTSSLAVTGALTLDAQGDPNAVWVFQIASTLTTLTGSQIILTGGAQASNVFWVVGSSATLGTTSVFKGTIMAYASITITTGATVDGRALAEVGAVTLDSNIITKPL